MPSEPSETTPPAAPTSDHVASIYAALGGCPVLLRIPRGKKGPLDKGWDRVTWEDTRDADYQEALRAGNVGVRLGCASKLEVAGETYHLCSVDVDEDAALTVFLERNPRLRETLVTRGKRGGNVWVWALKDSYPPMAYLKYARADGTPDPKRKWGEWRTDGTDDSGQARAFQTVIWGAHPDGGQYRRISEAAKPLLIDFSEVVWPDELALPWRKSALEELVAQHGAPWYESEKGAISLNPPFWVAAYAMERKVLHEPEEGRFYEYRPECGLWQIDSEAAIRWKFCGDFKRHADAAKKPQLETKRTNAFMQQLTSLLSGCVEKREAFRTEAGIVHLQNGMLDVRTNPPLLSSFSPDYFSRNQLAVALDESARCDRFLGELIGTGIDNADDVSLLQRWAGQLLLGKNLTQRIMVLTGTAGGGKTTLLNVLSRIIGAANVVGLRTKHLEERFELWNFVGKTFLIGADVPGNFLMTGGAHMLKSLVGKDVLTAEKKNGESVTVVGDFNVGLTSNSRLTVKLDGDTAAWRRRLLIVNYERPAPSRPIPNFLEDLMASEASGILNWMIEGAMELLAEVREGGLKLSEAQQDRVDSLLAESDSIREFCRKGIAPAQGFGVDVTTTELVSGYVHFCEARGWTPLPTRKVEQVLPDAILEVHRLARRNDISRDGKAARGYRNLRLLPVDERGEASP